MVHEVVNTLLVSGRTNPLEPCLRKNAKVRSRYASRLPVGRRTRWQTRDAFPGMRFQGTSTQSATKVLRASS